MSRLPAVRNLISFAVLTWALNATAQVNLQVTVPVPTIRFEAPPPLVVVQPGVQVVEDFDEEVFVLDGVYWVRRDKGWFKANGHSGGWVRAEPPRVLVAMPPGQYRKYKKAMRADDRDADSDHRGPGKAKGKGKGHGKH